MRDVAREAGVSTATVSRVLNGNYPVAKSTRERVLGVVEKLQYSANANARALASAATQTVGIILNDVVDPTFSYVVRGVEEEAARSRRLAIVAASRGDRDRELELIERMRGQRVDAVIVVGGGFADEAFRRKLGAHARGLASVGSRLVLCGRPSIGRDVPTKTVSYDNEGGAFAITEHLLGLGHTRVAFVGGFARLSTTIARIAGFRRALEMHGIPLRRDYERLGQFGRNFGYMATRELLEECGEVTAIVCGNDMVATGALDALTELRIRVPEDVSLVGYDDIPQAYELRPKLTTVHIPLEELGRQAVRIALDGEDIYGRQLGDSITLGTHVVVRESTAPPR